MSVRLPPFQRLRLPMLTGLALLGSIAAPLAAQRAEEGQPPASARVSQRLARMPNVVLIMADDLGIEIVNAYGGEYATPHIDQLAREGMRFEHAFATPLCTPSRTRILTGRENSRNYRAFGHLDPSETTFAHVLKKAGYATAITGKWQLAGNGFDGRIGMMPLDAGFDEALLWQVAAGPARGSRYWGPTLSDGVRNVVHEEGFGPDKTTDFAVEFIRRNRDRPFLLYYPIVLPHSPFVPTPDTVAAGGEKERFAGMVTYLDRLVGRVMDELARQGLDENTIVIFTGDNGTARKITSDRHGRAITGGKGMPTLNGTHVPMIVRWPGRVARGSTSAALFDLADIMPTLAEAANAPLQAGAVDGVSQLAVLTGKVTSMRDRIYIHYAPGWLFEPTRFVFDTRYKLYADGRFVELDMVAGTETLIEAPKGEAARRLAQFQRTLAQDRRPLEPTRYPFCAGKETLAPGVPPEIAGCPQIQSFAGNE